MDEFDYVVVGGGSAGCVVASRLSENPDVKVCLLEAGKAGDGWIITAPAATAIMLSAPINNWAFETVPQPGLNGRKGYQPRGKALGGSSAINAMVYIRGHKWDYDHWASLGNKGWSFEDVLPYFKRAENNEEIHDAFHGAGGPLYVAGLRTDNPVPHVFVEAARQCQLPLNRDFNGAEQEGVGVYQVTQKNGERWSAARAYIHPYMTRPNLSVVTQAAASKILFSNRRASGVQYRQGKETRAVKARREVILASGAFQSPQLLMLSGVGDGKHLRKFGIDVVHDLPSVGRNLQDHIDFVFCYSSESRDLFGISFGGIARLVREIGRYRKEGRGMITTNFAEAGGFLKTTPKEEIPDIQLHFVIGKVTDHGRKKSLGHGFSCHVCLLRPKSRGFVALQSADASAPPLIDPKFYEAAEDLDAMVRGFRLTKRILQAPALAGVRGEDLVTQGVETDDQIRGVLRDRSDTVYHPVGTCKMGVDADAVVDPELRVRGVEGLRVVDASIMPTLVGGNTNAPSIMIGEKAADLIRARH
jgi:choline dehydrogenase-like flavoprotein